LPTQTCGNSDFYTREVDEKRTVQSTIAGRVFTTVIPSDDLAPWVYPPGYVANSNLASTKTNPACQENGGILVNMMDEVAATHDTPLQPQLFKGFASKQARRFYPNSSFTACVMDVADISGIIGLVGPGKSALRYVPAQVTYSPEISGLCKALL
jgi:hypothetical protein